MARVIQEVPPVAEDRREHKVSKLHKMAAREGETLLMDNLMAMLVLGEALEIRQGSAALAVNPERADT